LLRRLLKKQLDRSFVFQRFKEELKTEYGTEKAAVLEGKNYMIVISPKSQTPAKKAKNADGDNSGEQ
jgi:translation initiation factor IF-3